MPKVFTCILIQEELRRKEREKEREERAKERAAREKERAAPPIREWDRDKLRQSKSRSRSRERRRRSRSAERRRERSDDRRTKKGRCRRKGFVLRYLLLNVNQICFSLTRAFFCRTLLFVCFSHCAVSLLVTVEIIAS